jgi:hypothetical protein
MTTLRYLIAGVITLPERLSILSGDLSDGPSIVALAKTEMSSVTLAKMDMSLAELYAVETKVLKQAVKRNIKRFPSDFMFELSKYEFQNLRSQFVTSSWGGSRYVQMVFTEHGVAMFTPLNAVPI